MEMKEPRILVNKEMIKSAKQSENDSINTFIGEDFEEQFEWAMILIASNLKQWNYYDGESHITMNHFDKAYLLLNNIMNNIQFFDTFSKYQATPDIFPLINIKALRFMSIGLKKPDGTITDNTIGHMIELSKIKELDISEKRRLWITKQYAYEISRALYQNNTNAFYGFRDGYQINPNYFDLKIKEKYIIDLKSKLDEYPFSALPRPISLNPSYRNPTWDRDIMQTNPLKISAAIFDIATAYQIAFSMYYEWCIHIKERDNIGIVIPVEPNLLSEMYKTSMLKFENRKKMIHFVRDHYRRKVANPNEDYSVYVHRYLRGESKFVYKDYETEIIPPRYDLNRAKTKKTFVKPEEDGNKITF